jgi:hypothetical protein
MSQVLSIRFSTNLSSGQISGFLSEWEQLGTWQAHSDRVYDLYPHSGGSLLLNCLETELEITGYPEDDALEFIDAYAGRHAGELLYEGEPMAKVQPIAKGTGLGAIFKTGRGIGGFLIMLVTIVALPAFLLIAVVRLIFYVGGDLLAARGKTRE